MLPEQLQPQPSEPITTVGFEGLVFEQFCMECTVPMCGTSPNADDSTLCDVTFIAELMESAMPACAMSSNPGDATLCDVTFITELMECDFAHTDHHNEAVDADHSTSIHLSNLNGEQFTHAYDAAADVDPDEDGKLSTHAQTESNPHPHSHGHSEQFDGSPNNDNVNLNLDGAISAHVQNASILHVWHNDHFREKLLARSLDNVDHINTGVEGGGATHIQDACGLHAHSQQHHGHQSHGFQDEMDHVELDPVGSRNQSTQTLQACVDQSTHELHANSLYASQTDDIKEFQGHNNNDCSIGLTPCGSNDSQSENSLLRSPHHIDVTKEALLAAVAEDRSVVPWSDKEKLKHHEDSIEKTHINNLNLLHLLLACAEAVSEDNLEVASVVFTRLQELSCKYGSPLQRLSFCLCNALEARILPSAQAEFRRSLKMPLPPCDMLETFCVFYNVNPIGRFCHLTLNQLILDNTLSDTHVHIVDLHIGYGMQWAAFLQAIALRPHGPPKLRLTAVGPMVSTGKKLMDMARTLQVPFEYCPIASQLQSLDVGMIDIREGEVCVISSLGQFHTLLHKGSEFVDAFLAGLRSLEPKVLVLAENDVNHNNPLFLNRFVECLQYYAAVFESLDAALPPTSQARLKIERLLCGRKIGSIVACEGAERVERHETMHDWMRKLERAGFRNASLTQTAVNQAKLLLNLYYPNGYSLTEDQEALTLRWNGAALMAIGIWH